MRRFKIALFAIFFLLVASTTTAQAIDILETSLTVPIEEKGQAWEHPPAFITGEGDLMIQSSTVDAVYEGEISCEVSASANVDIDNSVGIKADKIGTVRAAKSNVGTIAISNCILTDVNGVKDTINDSLTISNGKLKIDIEEYGVDEAGNLLFSEYVADGKIASGQDPRVRLQLRNGSVELIDLGCSTNAGCGSGEYCSFSTGMCSGSGTCQPIAEICLQVWIPVCGCDGETYSNACLAAQSGVSVAFNGSCP